PSPLTWNNAYLPNETPNYFSDRNHGYVGLFVEDQWRVTSKFTLNYGVRWDYETGLGDTVNNYYKAFQPRVGLAYSPDKHTVIRAGFGLFSDRYNIGFFFVTHPQRPTKFCLVPADPCTSFYPLPGIRHGGYNATYALNELPFVPPPSPFGKEPADAATALLLNGTYTPVALETNPFPTAKFPNGEFSTVGDGTVETGSKMPSAEQGSLEIDCELGHGLVVNAGYLFVSAHHQVRADNYTSSKTLDDGTFTTFVTTPQYLYHRSLERANSNQDVRHRFLANFTVAASKSKDTNMALRHWEVSGIITLQGARPFTIFVGHDANNDTNPVTDRVGLAGRNTYWGDKLKTVDLRFSRAFSLREHHKLELAADAFNIMNRDNVDEVDSVYTSPDFCGAAPHSYN